MPQQITVLKHHYARTLMHTVHGLNILTQYVNIWTLFASLQDHFCNNYFSYILILHTAFKTICSHTIATQETSLPIKQPHCPADRSQIKTKALSASVNVWIFPYHFTQFLQQTSSYGNNSSFRQYLHCLQDHHPQRRRHGSFKLHPYCL